MRKLSVENKEIFIVESHNQVLEAWEAYPGLNVFSLDYHTDTKMAFQNYSYWRTDSEVKSGRCRNPEERIQELRDQKIDQYLKKEITIGQINDNLKHDEHLDFAVRTNMIDMAFVLSKNSNASTANPNVYLSDGRNEYNNQRIIEFSPSCVPGCSKTEHDDACLELRADSSINDFFLEWAMTQTESIQKFFFNKYILDIDCDYFNSRKSLYPENIGIFKKLIRKSRLITIALEPECVKICRHKGSELTSETILERLLTIIEEA